MEELAEILDRLAAAGYRGSFRADGDGLRCETCHQLVGTDQIVFERAERLEGESDPDEELVVFALECPHCGTRGTYVVPYGPAMSGEDAAVVRRVKDGRDRAA